MKLFLGYRFSIPHEEHTAWRPGERAHLVRTISEHGGRLSYPCPTHILVTSPTRPIPAFMDYVYARPGAPVLPIGWVYECVSPPEAMEQHMSRVPYVVDPHTYERVDNWRRGMARATFDHRAPEQSQRPLPRYQPPPPPPVKHGLLTPPGMAHHGHPAPCVAPHAPRAPARMGCGAYRSYVPAQVSAASVCTAVQCNTTAVQAPCRSMPAPPCRGPPFTPRGRALLDLLFGAPRC